MQKRRHATQRPTMPSKLDEPCFMAAYAQSSQSWLEWHGRRMTVRHAEEMVAAGEAKVETRNTSNGLVRFYQETKPSRASQPTPCTLTLRTMLAAARRGASDLSGAERREIDKLVMWPYEHDRRNAATVGPKVGERERALAQAAYDRACGLSVFRPGRGKSEVQVWHAPEEVAA